MDKTIELRNLTKRYKNNRGIENISLEAYRGDIFGFLGPNGAGKTTAMKLMTGLMQPDMGEAFINGFSVQADFERAMSGMGCIVESVSLLPYMTAYENLKVCARYYDCVDDKRIDESLALTGMLQFRNEKTRSYSLGMRQRLGISAALLSRPQVLILDEPLNGLDVEGMVEMRNLFLSLSKEQGTTIFISSHLIHDVELTANRVGVLHEGRLLKTDYTSEILKNYSSLENYYISEVDAGAKL